MKITISIVALCFATTLQAQVVSVSNEEANNDTNWSNPAIWTPNGAPNGSNADVYIDGGKTAMRTQVNVNGAFTVGRVTIDKEDQLTVADGRSITISAGAFPGSGQIVNNGAILVGVFGAGNSELRINGNVTLGGGGFASMTNTISSVTNNPPNRLLATNPGDRLTIGPGATFAGAGLIGIGQMNLTNNGTVVALSKTQPLEIEPGNGSGVGDLLNNGTLRAGLSSTLQLSGASGATFTNNGAYQVTSRGTLNVPAGRLTNFVGTTLTGGSYEVYDSGTTLSLGGGNIVTNAASIVLSDNGSVFAESDTLADNQGSFTLSLGRAFQTKGNLANSGAISVQFQSALTVNGILAQDPNGSLGGAGKVIGTALNLHGKITPTGELTLQGPVVLASDSTVEVQVNNATQMKVVGSLTLAGILRVGLGAGFVPKPTDTFTIVSSSSAIVGAFSNIATGERIQNVDGTGSFKITVNSQQIILTDFLPNPTNTRLLNISTRLRVLSSDNVLIGGFILTGSDPKKVIVRGIGPSLANPQLSAVLADPVLELRDGGGGLVASNDNWKDLQRTEVTATTIPPSNNLESAIVATLPANNSAYTAILRGKDGGTGIGLVEVYDLGQSANPKLANISTRGFVDTGDNVLIGGFIVGGGGGGSAKVVVRGIGPSLTASGVAGALQDTTLELHDGSGTTVASNDNWKDTQQAELEVTGIPPRDDRESAIVQTLAPGNYTAIVSGKGSTTGVGLVEVYNVQ